MRKILLDAAQQLMGQGITPSVAELAEHAQVSRATAYRYFPSQSALIAAVVDESLGPILAWESSADDAGARVDDCCASPTRAWRARGRCAPPSRSRCNSTPRPAPAAPATSRAWCAATVDILKRAIAPLAGALTPAQQERVAQALSLVYGTEVFLVLKDIWRLDLPEVTEVARWTAQAIIRQALADAGAATPGKKDKPTKGGKKATGAAARPPGSRRRAPAPRPRSGARRRQPVIPTSPAAGIVPPCAAPRVAGRPDAGAMNAVRSNPPAAGPDALVAGLRNPVERLWRQRRR